MLFDLRGSGRRRTIKVVYITLALLMGGGLVLFGIGGSGALSGGLVDAITQSEGGGGDERFQEQEQRATAAARANPEDPALWAAAARARFNLASVNADTSTGQFSEEGRTQLEAAGRAWEEHLELAGKNPDSRVASLMVQAYTVLGQYDKAAVAQEVIALDRESVGAYTQLAILAYQAGQLRKGDLAKDKALELTEPDMRETLRGQLESARTQAAQAAGEGAPAPTPEG
jgi:tetratricopeptide (TPR) repeat protein